MNQLWIDIKYANLISIFLPLCTPKKKGDRYGINFRCPLCGDSKLNRYKKRGWIYEQKGHLFFKCFNCGRSAYFNVFLKENFPEHYREYALEQFKEKMVASPPKPFEHQIEKFDKRRIQKFQIFKGIPKISQLPNDHPARLYVNKRKIPENQHFRIFYVDKFLQWVNSVKSETFDDRALKFDEPRIVFPLIDQEGYVFGFQGRSLKPDSKQRYITIMLREDRPKFFGLDLYDPEKLVFVVEGPIDSLFLPNCIAMVGADAQLDLVARRNSSIIVFDNEPRNLEIVSRIDKYIDQGFSVCLWPSDIKHKDINDMVASGISASEVQDIIVKNSFSGLQAKLKMKDWRKV